MNFVSFKKKKSRIKYATERKTIQKILRLSKISQKDNFIVFEDGKNMHPIVCILHFFVK
jgi:hypothetical protein